jgi:HAD superfamily hydrolase (TIGR01549 family)
MPLHNAVIFDLDGTVADTLGPTFRAFQDAVEPALGKRPSREEILERFGPADHEIVSRWVGPEQAQDAVRRLYDAYETAFQDAQPFDGMVGLLETLRRDNRPLGLFTGRGRKSTDQILGLLNLDTWFDVVVCGDEIERPKPDPQGLTEILRRLNEREEEAVYVGDTVKDLESARAAGIPFIAALWGSPEAVRLEAKAARVVRTVAELERLLKPPA